MVGRRVAAIVGAILMVAVAVVARGQLDKQGLRPLRIVCATELEAPCQALAAAVAKVDVTVEPAGKTADRLIALEDRATLDLDAWIVPGPWSAIVDGSRRVVGKSPLFDGDPVALAFSPIVAVSVSNPCQDWACLAGRVVSGNKRLRFSIADPHIHASGLAALGALEVGALGVGFGSQDLGGKGRQIIDAARKPDDRGVPGDIVNRAIGFRFVKAEVVFTTEAEAQPAIDASVALKPTITLPTPEVDAVVAFARPAAVADATTSQRVSALAAPIAAALTDARWRPGPPPDATAGRLDPDVLAALRGATA